MNFYNIQNKVAYIDNSVEMLLSINHAFNILPLIYYFQVKIKVKS